jgi:hypothetical protein
MRTASKDFGLAITKAKEIMDQSLYELHNEFTSFEFAKMTDKFKLNKVIKSYSTRNKIRTEYLKTNCHFSFNKRRYKKLCSNSVI